MKRLNDLRKQLPSNAKLNSFESTRVKGGAEKQAKRNGKRPSGNGNAYGYGSNNGDGNGNANGSGGN